MAVTEGIVLRDLLTILADSAVTSVRVGSRGVEVRRGARLEHRALAQHGSAISETVERLIGPGRTSGAVALRGFIGFAALPPVALDPIIVMHRPGTPRHTPDAIMAAGLLTHDVARLATSTLAGGAGVLVAGPRGTRLTLVLSALVQLLPSATPLALVEDEPQIALTWDVLRFRDLPAELLRSVGDLFIVIDLIRPFPLLGLTPPILASIRARTPQAACTRACGSVSGLSRVEQAVLLADLVPLLLWYEPASRLTAVYELLPVVDPVGGVCRLQMLLGTDPISGALVPTGAAPRDLHLAAAWHTLAR